MITEAVKQEARDYIERAKGNDPAHDSALMFAQAIVTQEPAANPSPSPWQPMTDAVDIAHLGKLGEESGELVAIIFRCLIQGIDEVEPTTKKVNRKALQDEIADVLAMSDMAVSRFQLDHLEIEQRIERKKAMKREWHQLIKAGAITAFGVLREIAAQSDGNWAIEMANQWLNRIKGTIVEAQPWRGQK